MNKLLNDFKDEELIKKAYFLLFYENCNYHCKLTFSSRFQDFGANISLKNNSFLELRASKKWLEIDNDIFIGLIHNLLIKLFNRKFKNLQKSKTKKFDDYYLILYNNFVKNLDLYELSKPKEEKNDPILIELFHEINKEYFNNTLEMPHLVFGKKSTTQMGKYSFRTDTITISGIFKKELYRQYFYQRGNKTSFNKDHSLSESLFHKFEFDVINLVKLVLYHELLHKKLKFKSSSNHSGRNRYHTGEFRRLEKQFENYEFYEKQLKDFVRVFSRNNSNLKRSFGKNKPKFNFFKRFN